jgi:CMP-N-acetylneuraminic acid synthetase
MKKNGLTAEDCRRQALETTYLPYSFYLSLWSSFQRYKLFYQPKTIPCFLKREQMIEIDDEVDFFMAECMMKKFVIPAWEKGAQV